MNMPPKILLMTWHYWDFLEEGKLGLCLITVFKISFLLLRIKKMKTCLVINCYQDMILSIFMKINVFLDSII